MASPRIAPPSDLLCEDGAGEVLAALIECDNESVTDAGGDCTSLLNTPVIVTPGTAFRQFHQREFSEANMTTGGIDSLSIPLHQFALRPVFQTADADHG